MRRIEYVKVLVVVIGLMMAGRGAVWGAAGDLVWKLDIGSPINGCVAIGDDGTIYCCADDKKIYAISAEGNVLWDKYVGTNSWASPSIGYDGTIYVPGDRIYAINPDGTSKWEYLVDGSSGNLSLAIGIDGTVYALMNKLYAVNSDGTIKWILEGMKSSGTPIISEDETIYFMSNQYKNLWAVTSEGDVKWKYEIGIDPGYNISIGTDGVIYFGDRNVINDQQAGSIYAVNPDGTLQWKYTTNRIVTTSPAIQNEGILYLVSSGLYSINSNGSINWNNTDSTGEYTFPLIGKDGTIYMGGRGEINALNPNGTNKFSYQTGEIYDPEIHDGPWDISVWGSGNISDDGVLYFGSSTYGILYAIDTGTNAGLADSPWPKFQCNNKNTGRKSEMYFAEIPGGMVDGVQVESFQMGITEVTNQQYADYLNEALAEDFIRISGDSVYSNSGMYNGKLLFDLSDTHYSGYWDGALVQDTAINCWIDYDGGKFITESGKENLPVEVTNYGARAYALFSGYDLPTSNEWKWTAQGGKGYNYGTSDGTMMNDTANFGYTNKSFVDVGSYPPNPYGLYDLAGNAWEFTRESTRKWGGDFFAGAEYAKNSFDNIGGYAGFRVSSYGQNPRLTCPSGGEIIQPGTSFGITWQYKHSDVNLSYSIDNGTSWTFIDLVNGADGMYLWTVPDVSSNNCLIRISDSDNVELAVSNEVAFSIVDNSDKITRGIHFVLIPEGSFQMGADFSSVNANGEKPAHNVRLNTYQMSQYEITQDQYESIMDINPSETKYHGSLPVTNVSWNDAVKFCNALSEIENLGKCNDTSTWECDFQKNGYRLPTEAEWENACRAGTTSEWFFGDLWTDLVNYGWYDENSTSVIHPIGNRVPNEWGIYDVYGNVAEWCNDWLDMLYYSNSPETNPFGPASGEEKSVRGGEYWHYSWMCTSAHRDAGMYEGQSSDRIGFRIVRRESRTIQGKILDQDGNPVQAVTVQVSGEVIGNSLTTDENGVFTISGWLGGDYIITPNKVGCTFSPASLTVSVGFEDITDADFTATVDEKYIIEHGITLASIPAGVFQMGSNDGEENEKPIHTVSLDGFLMSATEVTQGQYEVIMGNNPSSNAGDMSLPVDMVDRPDVLAYCNALSIKHGLEPCYDSTTWVCDFSKSGYRLPTEAEWEFSCRASTMTKFNTGDNTSDLSRAGWFRDNSGYQSHPVGQKESNRWGLFDMHGNLHEMCHDWYDSEYYTISQSHNPVGPQTGIKHVVRGGSYDNPDSDQCRSTYRIDRSDSGGENLGFRIVRRPTRSLQGTVNLSGSPLKDAHLLITGAAMDTVVTTDDTGSFSLSGWLGGDYTITPRKVGYTFSPDTTHVSVGFEDVTIDDFEAEVDERYVVEQGIHFAKIPAGSFEMGNIGVAGPIHSVSLDGYIMSATEITQEQYTIVTGTNSFYNIGNSLPADLIRWYDAINFCNLLSERAGIAKCYDESTWDCDFTKAGYRLASEAEWEYATKAGTTTEFPTGNSESDFDRVGWYAGNSNGETHFVGLKEPNNWGLYDVLGNVWEWVNDWAGSYSVDQQRNPTGPPTQQSGLENVGIVRGGIAIRQEFSGLGASHRNFGNNKNGNNSDFGFRIVRSLFTIEGTILDDSGNPVNGAEILIASANTDTTVTTDENGFYNLSGLEKGSYTLSPSKFGYGFAEPSYTVSTEERPQIANITALSYLTLTSPQGGEFWETGTEQQITWTSNFLSTIKIEYSDDGGASWSMIESSIDATLGTYAWTVLDLESTDCMIRVTDTIDANVTDKSDAVFTVTKPISLTLTSMNEGEELINLDSYQITWESHRIDKIRIEYSPDNGGRWTSIESSVDAATGTYDWTVPDIVTSECLIRLIDTTDANMNALSEAAFVVIDPTFLTLLAPIGGEQLTQDSAYEIRWDFFRVSKIRIEYTPDGGTRWVTVTSSANTADSLFVWTVPAVNSAECKIRITDLSDANFTDMSEVFGIVPPSELMVTSPNGGEQWTAGTTETITWTSAMLTKVTIEYSADGGESWLPVAEALDASAGTYDFEVPDTPSTNCLVRISDSEKPGTTDRSDSAFTTLPAPKVTVTSPNGDEQWAAMTVRDITWDAVNVTSVRIEYSTNSGTDWTVIAETVDATTGSYAWTLPDLASDGCLVRITSTDDPTVKDASDEEFGILQIPAVVILSPNGGENLIAGSTVDIKWSSAYIDYVSVELSTDNGTTWITLADAKGGTLLLPWTVPDTYSDQCLIRVYNADNADVVDVSDAVFSIVPPPTLAVTAPTESDIWKAGTQATITWTSLSINTLKIEYSTDNGDNWTVIEENTNASVGSITFDVPDLYSGQSIIRVTDADNVDTVALSETFTILPSPDVTIVSPNGGEEFEFGSTQTIQWNATESVANILLEYSTDGGSIWNTLGSALNAADGSLSWDVPAIESADCLVRATDTNDANINDQSDESFSITEAPYLILTTPNGEETLTSGDSFDITWDAHRIPNIRIDYSPDGGTQWIKIADSVDGADGSLSWSVPDVSSTDCLIRIVDEQDANRKDTSEEAFSIVPKPAITVTYPNGGETLNVGSLQTITWTSMSILTVKIEYSLDDGSSWLPIIGSVPASDGSYSWSVIDLVSSNCLVRISDTGTTGITDMSDTVFTSVKTSFVQLTSPVGGEIWLPGSDHNISWTGSSVTNIKIELSTDGGTTWSDIVASINILLGSYSWTVPAIESSDCIIRISDASDAGINDQNITAFTVAPEKENPISIESVTILDETGPYNVKTDTLDVVVTLRNLTDQVVSDISFVCTVDGNAVMPYYGALDTDGAIDSIGASASMVTVIGKVYLPSSSDSRTIAITQVIADGDTYTLSYEDDITMVYANRDDGGTPVAYDPAVDGFSFVNPPGWSWHAFKDELKALDASFVTKSNAVFPFFSKFANWKGRSLGMAAASNIYFSDPSLKPTSVDTYDMSLADSDVSRDIMLYGLRTLFDYLEDEEQAYDDMSELISDAKTQLASGEPFILLLKKNQGKAVGKAVSVYKLFEHDTETILVAYDCEYPDGTPQFISVSTVNNTLTADDTYDQASIVYQETLSDDYAIGEEIFEPYTKKFVSKLWNDNKDFFGHASPARMLVTDPSTDNQVGFVDGTTLVNEITGASVVEIPNEEDGTGYAFYVPHGPDYTVEFFGQETGTMYVDMIAPQSETNAAEIVFEEVEVQSGTVAIMEEIDLSKATPPSLQVDLNGDGTTDNTLEPTETVTIITEPVTTSITLLTPSGGERWIAGSDQSITWASTGLTTVKLEHSADNGATWVEISSSTQASATAYSWTVPMIESAQYLVRISDAVDSSLMDVCNTDFEIFVPATTISHTPVTEATENQAITFSASITSDTELTDVTLYYDVSGRRTFDKTLAMATNNDQDYSVEMRQGLFTALGIEYYIVAIDSDGKETRDPVGTGYNSIQASLSEAISTYNILGGSEVNSYRMISVPLALSHTSITEQLAGRLPTGDKVYDWRLYQYIDQTTGYKEYPEIDGFTPGKAKWIIINEGNSFNHKTHEGKSVATSTSYQVTLKPGWNLIADPWFFPILWTNIENPAGATLSELYSYEGNWSDPTNPPVTLEPWKGYAVRNMEQYSAVIDFQPIQAGSTPKIATYVKPLWTVQIAASGGGATDTANYFGAHRSSSLAWDRNDHVEPPPIGQYVSVAFPHDDWKKHPADYTVDMRSPESVMEGWNFDVRTNLPGEEITISLIESETVPVDIDLAVIDLDSGQPISLFNGTFSFVTGDTPTDRHFAVTVGDTYQPEDDQTNVTPQQFVTTLSFPNPFNPVTTISYELSHQADVVISVYNTLGQMVRKYDLGMKDAGPHDLVFDTLGLTSGIYIYRVDAGYATATDKMMFMK